MANPISGIDEAGRKIAGLLTYNPGPGIYSRLERAIEQMPENVRVQELPGLLKRYKEGVPGWELKETDLDSVIAGRDAVSRSELLARVKERSPVYTHKEIVLGGTPQDTSGYVRDKLAVGSPSPLGAGGPHGDAVYGAYSQGGKDYTELLVGQPTVAGEYGSHWGRGSAKPAAKQYERNNIIAHARFDTHGDALRINELQSDLGIHNRKAREYAAQNPQTAIVDGQHVVQNDPSAQGLPFPLEDTWSDLLIKRLALEAARKGHRAIEVASPRAIADKVGGNIDNYEHFYGKVVPGALERLGRKMGGLTEDSGALSEVSINTPSAVRAAAAEAMGSANAFMWRTRRKAPGMGADLMEDEYGEMVRKMTLMRKAGHGEDVLDRFLAENYQAAYQAGVKSLTDGNMQLGAARKQAGLAVGELIARAKAQSALEASLPAFNPKGDAGRRYIMSDEMRRRLIEQGVGASLLAPLLMQEGE
jgi:hypothetical protein